MAYAAPLALPVEGGIEHSFERSAELAIAETLGDMGDATESIQVDQRVVEGAAAKVLVTEAEKAELLVVGSRGHGGFAGLLLGSVSQQCAQHAPCPVVIVRDRKP
jgi:nucleotide-binding universal stress UspA family protein